MGNFFGSRDDTKVEEIIIYVSLKNHNDKHKLTLSASLTPEQLKEQVYDFAKTLALKIKPTEALHEHVQHQFDLIPMSFGQKKLISNVSYEGLHRRGSELHDHTHSHHSDSFHSNVSSHRNENDLVIPGATQV